MNSIEGDSKPVLLSLGIAQVLETLGIAYRERESRLPLPASQRVQASLLEDQAGALLVLFPQSQLLDLARLSELTGRKLRTVRETHLETPFGKYPCNQLPGLPALNRTPCLYEEALLDEAQLLIESGNPGLLLEIHGADFRRLLSDAQAQGARFGVALASIHPNHDRPADDRAEITQAVQAFTARRIKQRLEESIEIPPLPETSQRMLRLRNDPKATAADLAAVVETDPALAAQVISWASSAYYARQGKVRSVEDAIIRVLGFDLLIGLTLSLSLSKSLDLPKDQPKQATPYWNLAIYHAVVIEELAGTLPYSRRPEIGLSYLVGLLHNIGYLVLAHIFPPHFSLICRHLEANPHVEHYLLEQYLLGITREQIGAWLMSIWGMPEELCTALRFQADPGYQGEHAAYANLACLASRLLRQQGIGNGPLQEIPQALLQHLGITQELADKALRKVLDAEAALRELASQFKMPPKEN